MRAMLKIPNYSDISNASSQVATNSAMNPILWKSVIAFPVAAIVSALAPSPINYFILGIGSLPIIFGCINFTIFAVRDPSRLQSEKHIENMEVISRSSVFDAATGRLIEVHGENVRPDIPLIEGGNNG